MHVSFSLRADTDAPPVQVGLVGQRHQWWQCASGMQAKHSINALRDTHSVSAPAAGYQTAVGPLAFGLEGVSIVDAPARHSLPADTAVLVEATSGPMWRHVSNASLLVEDVRALPRCRGHMPKAVRPQR